MDGDVVLGCFGAILKTFFVTVASKCFSLFQLYRHPNGSFSMRASPEVLQGSEEWSSASDRQSTQHSLAFDL